MTQCRFHRVRFCCTADGLDSFRVTSVFWWMTSRPWSPPYSLWFLVCWTVCLTRWAYRCSLHVCDLEEPVILRVIRETRLNLLQETFLHIYSNFHIFLPEVWPTCFQTHLKCMFLQTPSLKCCEFGSRITCIRKRITHSLPTVFHQNESIWNVIVL